MRRRFSSEHREPLAGLIASFVAATDLLFLQSGPREASRLRLIFL